MKLFEEKEVEKAVALLENLEELIRLQRQAFIDFTAGLYDVPQPMQLYFPEARGDSHIKAAYKKKSDFFVVKIASSSPLGGNGVVLVFSSLTGELLATLHDKGVLTTLRTALAGVVVSECLPWPIQKIGIVGSGNLAKMLYKILKAHYPHLPITLFARNSEKGLQITEQLSDSIEKLVEDCDLIFTTTSSDQPLIHTMGSNSWKTIVALGSDDEKKRELDVGLYGECDLILVDSYKQALRFGDVAKAISSGLINPKSIVEIGAVLQSGIVASAQRIIADFSGIGAQDFAMVEYLARKGLF